MIDIWYQLYGKDGKPYLESCPAIVSVEAGCVVAKLKDAIYEKNKPILPEIFVASLLKVYESVNPNQGSFSATMSLTDESGRNFSVQRLNERSCVNPNANTLYVEVPARGINS